MKRLLPLLGVLLVAAAPSLARQDGAAKQDGAARQDAKPENAQVLLDAARKTAKARKKSVFVLFDASW